MYLTHAKGLLVKAMRTTFDADYPEEDFRDVPVSIEFPTKKNQVPGIWLNYDPIGPIHPVGVGYFEDNLDVDTGGFYRSTRWSYAGAAIYTVVAHSSLERDRLFDQVVSAIAFGQFDTQRGEFRETIESDPLIAMQVDFDQIDQRGFSAAPGTPWGSNEVIYEASISVRVTGEFISQPGTTLLMPISQIDVYQWVTDLESDPVPTGTWLG